MKNELNNWRLQSFPFFASSAGRELHPHSYFIFFFWLRRQGQSVHPEKKRVALELERLLLGLFFFYQPWMKKSISAFRNKSLAAAAATSLCLSPHRAAAVRCSRSQTSCNEHATTESPPKSPLERATLPGDKITPELIDYLHRHIFFFFS